MSLADLDRWKPASVRDVAAAAANRANHFRDIARSQRAIVASLVWRGVSRERVVAKAREIGTDLREHADECDQTGREVLSWASQVESIKAEWTRIQRLADRWGITIDVATETLECFPSADPEEGAEDERHLQIVHDAIVDLLRQADWTDRHLASAVARSATAMADGESAAAPLTPDSAQRQNQIASFRRTFGRDPLSDADWATAAALDPHSYDPKNDGVDATVVVARIKPVPGQGVVRTNLFIPSADVWAPALESPLFTGQLMPYDNNLGDNRGFDPSVVPEASRVSIYTDFENGIIVARQNPSVNADTGQVRAGTPNISAVQQANGAVLLRYNAADPFSPGGERVAKAVPFSVNGTLGIRPEADGPRVGGTVTSFPALEIYSDRNGTTAPLLQSWPSLTADASGPLFGLLPHKDVGDPTVVTSFTSVLPRFEPPQLGPVHGLAPAPSTPPIWIVPPENFTPFGPATSAEVPVVRVHTPLRSDEFLPSR
ncbi:hypothetical protein [Mycobacterium sp. shizuoka-1]|uniref:hypothetical protein n=1 Tax=Mycobacterium sp. shizuoka-1 TaxID=2039281 RepID=UPI000C05D10E|nr:hypothetical protein [Mycobacterium sp. shizuoka-1]GAY14237.1 hypothetical protein MSZK_09630 [Mycobacterium sp. shizuoka-1]